MVNYYYNPHTNTTTYINFTANGTTTFSFSGKCNNFSSSFINANNGFYFDNDSDGYDSDSYDSDTYNANNNGSYNSSNGHHQTFTSPNLTIGGHHNVINGANCRVTGHHNIIKGANCIVTGHHNTILGANCKVTGHHNTLNGANGWVTGNHNLLTGPNCTAHGQHNRSTGSTSNGDRERREQQQREQQQRAEQQRHREQQQRAERQRAEQQQRQWEQQRQDEPTRNNYKNDGNENTNNSNADDSYDPNNDFYKYFDVSDHASTKDIKKAFHKLSLTHHPDKNGCSAESTATFQKINEIYQLLCDPMQRKVYDDSRARYLQEQQQRQRQQDEEDRKKRHTKKAPSSKSRVMCEVKGVEFAYGARVVDKDGKKGAIVGQTVARFKVHFDGDKNHKLRAPQSIFPIIKA